MTPGEAGAPRCDSLVEFGDGWNSAGREGVPCIPSTRNLRSTDVSEVRGLRSAYCPISRIPQKKQSKANAKATTTDPEAARRRRGRVQPGEYEEGLFEVHPTGGPAHPGRRRPSPRAQIW